MYEQLKDEKIEQLEMLLSDQDNISMDARRWARRGWRGPFHHMAWLQERSDGLRQPSSAAAMLGTRSRA
jgi:hypothetical protein